MPPVVITKINADGGARVTVDNGADASGRPQVRQWDVRADQVAAHIPTFQAAGISAGDVSALQDAASATSKQIAS